MPILRFLAENARWLGAGAMLTFLSSFGQTYFISIFSGEIREAFALSHGAWGGIYTLGTTASAVVMIWAGALTDRFRSRALGAWVLALLGVSCLVMAVNPWAALLPAVIFALRFFGQGLASHIANVSMARWFDATRGRALSIAGLGFAAGQAVLPVAFVWLLLAMDWRGLWIVSAVVCALAIPLLLWLLQAERTPQSHARSVQAAGMGGRHWDRRAVLRHGLFWFMVPALLGPAAFNTAFFFQQVPFAEAKGWPLIGLVALFPVYTAMSVAAMLASGWLLDRFGTARLIPWYQLPMVAGFLVFALGDSLAWATVGLLFLALTQGGNATLPPAFWAEFYGTRHLGAIKAMAAAIMVFGTALGPGLTGALIDAGLGIESQYIYVAGYFVFATAMMAIGVGRVLRSTPVTAGQP